jgi:hypothetical protein
MFVVMIEVFVIFLSQATTIGLPTDDLLWTPIALDNACNLDDVRWPKKLLKISVFIFLFFIISIIIAI